jgi:hypothetical protein
MFLYVQRQSSPFLSIKIWLLFIKFHPTLGAVLPITIGSVVCIVMGDVLTVSRERKMKK